MADFACLVLARLVAVGVLLSMLPAHAHAVSLERVEIAGGIAAAHPLVAYLARPSGVSGPRPAVVALHGCGGLFRSDGSFGARDQDWADRLTARGYAVLFPDSFGSRGLGSQCSVKTRTIVPRGRAADALAALAWLAQQPFADAFRLALLGWSNGGSSVLWAVDAETSPSPIVDVKTAIAFYPGCRLLAQRNRWRSRVPLHILICEADDWTPAAPCVELGQRPQVRTVTYPGAYHDFDAPSMPIRVRTGLAFSADGSGAAHVGTDPVARAAAIIEVERVLTEAFK